MFVNRNFSRPIFDIYEISRVYDIDENKTIEIDEIFKEDIKSPIFVRYTQRETKYCRVVDGYAYSKKRRTQIPMYETIRVVQTDKYITTYSRFDSQYRNLILKLNKNKSIT